MQKIRICTYNIHKGFSQFNRRMVIHELRDRLHTLDPDVVFLQEVQGMHLRHARRHVNWPCQPQYEFLADARWQSAYGGNAAYLNGHHGNAVLSRYRIVSSNNHDVTQHRLERRGLLHCQLELPDPHRLVHCICVHLSLTEQQRERQLAALEYYINRRVPRSAPLIIAGDFNDWRNRADDWASERLGLSEAFVTHAGRPARSFPSKLPVLRLDRIYLRGFDVSGVEVHWGKPWSAISDHAPLTAEIRLS